MNGFIPLNTYQSLPSSFFTSVYPAKVKMPSLVLFNDELADFLGLDFKNCSNEEKAQLFSGNKLPETFHPIAQAYAGHQFGHFTQLGDGRAHLITEHLTPQNSVVDIQLKGSGQTPYSRRGDGRAALGPMLREYLISESMHALKIPTTRSLAVILTGESVYRETMLPGAVLTRIASSHIRVGTFEFAASSNDNSLSEQLLNFAIDRHYPFLKSISQDTNEPIALLFLKEVIQKQISLITHWMRVGFIHGVMNTDNTTISGETIDYGPCAFLDHYDPSTVFSSIDTYGRYAFANQASITVWNLARLAESILHLIHPNQKTAIEIATDTLNQFMPNYEKSWLQMMGNKIGFQNITSTEHPLVERLLQWMKTQHADYTNTFLFLNEVLESMEVFKTKINDQHLLVASHLNSTYLSPNQELFQWIEDWTQKLSESNITPMQARQLMQSANPRVIPRNHLVEEAIQEAHHHEFTKLNRLLDILKMPYRQTRTGMNYYQTPPTQNQRVHQTFCGT